MTRLRWGLGAALVLLSLTSAARALSAYWSHHLLLGSAAVVMLAAIAVVGLVSLGRARWRIAQELDGLAASPPTGELWTARVAKLRAIRQSDAPFDRDALAAATEAEERGRAYLGRYLVAVTVLVGLVGTFAGLMETLRAVGPLLRDERVSTLQMLAAPLGGLDVTFGASVVGILVTLALALVQGDLVLAEELALSRLEERTVHLLVPSLWPRAEAADERAARELASLRAELATAIDRAGEAAAARVADVAGGAVAQLVSQVAARLDGAAQSVAGALATAAERGATAQAESTTAARAELQRLLDATNRLREETGTLLGAQRDAQAKQLAELARVEKQALAQVTAEASAQRQIVAAQTAELRAQLEVLAERLEGAHAQAAARLETVAQEAGARFESLQEAFSERLAQAHAATAERLERAQLEASASAAAALAEQTRAQGESWQAAATAAREALHGAVGDVGARFDAAATALAASAAELRAGVEAVTPSLQTLGPELGALAREVALLAARAESPDEGLLADELVRLGEGVERLEALLRLERGDPDHDAERDAEGEPS